MLRLGEAASLIYNYRLSVDVSFLRCSLRAAGALSSQEIKLSIFFCFSSSPDCLVGLVVKASASRAEDPGFESRLRRDFFGVESYL